MLANNTGAIVAVRKSCGSTSYRNHGFVVAMDTDRADLIVSLCTQAGMLMEDASLLAVTMRREAGDGVGVALSRLQTDIATMAALIAAATVLHDHH